MICKQEVRGSAPGAGVPVTCPSEWTVTVAYGRQRAERRADAGQRFRR
jgi:hypothetical protein